MKVALQLHEACSLKRGSLRQGQEEWMFRNIRVPSFVPTLEGCHSWLAQRASQAESGVRVVTWPCSHPPKMLQSNTLRFPTRRWAEDLAFSQLAWDLPLMAGVRGWVGCCSASPLGSDSCKLSYVPGVFIDLPKCNYFQQLLAAQTFPCG